MKWDGGPPWAEQQYILEHWNKWFAWYPVRLWIEVEDTNGIRSWIKSHKMIWLQTIERIEYEHPGCITSPSYADFKYREC